MRLAPFLLARGLGVAALACAAAWATAARADDETVRTKTGSAYRGEVIERVPGDHVTIKMPGLIKRIEWADIDTSPPPPESTGPSIEVVHMRDGSVIRGELVEKLAGDHVVVRIATGAVRRIEWRDLDDTPAPPAPAPAAEAESEAVETFRTLDGSLYRGTLVEKVVGDHVLVRISTGAVRRIEWRDLDTKPAPPPAPTAPEMETIHTRSGNVYRGEVVEKNADDHIVIKMALGKIQRIEWDDIDFAPRARPRPKAQPEEPEPTLTFTADDDKATLQRLDEDTWEYADVCTSPCRDPAASSGLFRVAGEGFAPSKPFPLRTSRDNRITASMASTTPRIVGSAVLISLGSAGAVVGTLITLVGFAELNGYYSSPGLVILGGAGLGFLGSVLLTTGILLISTARSSVTVNGHVATLRLPGHTELGVDGLHF